jgi:WD40 repeat protein/energy-coupling factor transporter ATP-binding protein EcfA2
MSQNQNDFEDQSSLQKQSLGDVQVQGDDNTFNVIQAQNITLTQTKIIQISVDEIKTRELNTTSPYKGLKKFEPEDADRFFGRDQFLDNLVNELEQTNLVLLLGASGSGKSSVVRAGLIPWLSQKWGNKFVDLILTPDRDPFESLYGSLLSRGFNQAQAELARAGKGETLSQVVKMLKTPESFWLIFIDQFEELFTVSDDEKRDRFINGLVQLSKEQASNPLLKIVATMRSDFLDRLDPAPANRLARLTEKHRPLITQMHEDELRLAIEQPAAHHGVVFESGLVKQIIDDVQGQAGYLPLLQYTLNLLWETEVQTQSIEDRTLNINNYRKLGGVRGALQLHVDKIYDSLSEAEALAARTIFLKLVDIGEDEESGTEWKPIRQRANRSNFSDPHEQTVLTQLIDQNLLVSNRATDSKESTIEIAHEILLTSWITLNTWIKENRKAITLRNRLDDDVARWQNTKKEDELWGGSKLAQVLELRQDSTFNQVLRGFSPTANQFIDASEGKRDRQRRKVITRMAGFSAITLILALIAFISYLDATKQRISAELKTMVAKSELLAADGNHFEALIASLEAARKLEQTPFMFNSDDRTLVTASLQQVIGDVKEYNRLEGHTYNVTSVSFSPTEPIIASASQDGTVQLWNQNGTHWKTLAGHSDVVNGVSFSEDGKTIASASGDGTIRLWTTKGIPISFEQQKQQFSKFNSINLSSTGEIVTASNNGTISIWNQKGRIQKTWTGYKDCDKASCIKSITFNSQGNLIASAGEDGIIKLWNREGKLQNERKYVKSVNTASFSHDGVIIAGAEDGKLILWNPPSQLKIWTAHSGSVNGVSFSPDGQTIASAGRDRTIKLWDRKGNLQPLMTLQGHTDSVNSVTFSPDEQTIASASLDNTIKLWRIDHKGIRRFDITTGSTKMTPMISPDGTFLASLSKDSAIRVWDVRGKQGNMKPFRQPNNRIFGIGWNADGQKIASIGEQDTHDSSGKFSTSHVTLKLWDLNGQIEKSLQLVGEQQWTVQNVESLHFSLDGKWVAFGCDDGTVNLWDLEQNILKSIPTSKKAVKDVTFSPDGRVIASASNDYTVKLWSLSGQLLRAFEQKHQDSINSISFSPNGQMIASASSDGSIQIWDRKGIPLNTLKGHNGKVFSVSFSPDGNLIASTGADKTVRLWSRKGSLLSTLRGHSTDVKDVHFTKSGTMLISIDQNNSVILWNLNLKDLMQRGCNWLKDYFTSNFNGKKKQKELCPP